MGAQGRRCSVTWTAYLAEGTREAAGTVLQARGRYARGGQAGVRGRVWGPGLWDWIGSQKAAGQLGGGWGPSPLYRRWEWAMSWSITRCICRSFRGQKSSRRALFCRKTAGGRRGRAPVLLELATATRHSHTKDRPCP